MRTLQVESTWTPAREDCPHPEWWHAPDDESAELEVSALVAGFVRALQPEIVVETGSAYGQTAEGIGMALVENEHGHLYTLEPDSRRAAITEHRCSGLPVTVLELLSLEWTPPGEVGFAWLDSLIDIRVDEARHLRPYLRPGAVVGFHDTGPQHGYRGAVEALADEGWIRFIHLPTPRGVMFGEVIE